MERNIAYISKEHLQVSTTSSKESPVRASYQGKAAFKDNGKSRTL